MMFKGVDAGAVGDRVLQDCDAGRLQPRRGGRDRVAELDLAPVRGRPRLDHRDRRVAAVDAGRVGQRAAFDVHVQTRHVVGRDRLLVRGGDLRTRRCRVGNPGAALVGAPATNERITSPPSVRSAAMSVRYRPEATVCELLPFHTSVHERLFRGLEERQREVLAPRLLRGGGDAVGRPPSRSTGRRRAPAVQ